MAHTTLGSNSTLIPKRVSRYAYVGDLMNAEYASLVLPYASGGILSTLSDLIKLVNVFRGEALLNEKSIQEMFGPVHLNNGTRYQTSDPGLIMTFGYGLDSIVLKEKIIPAKTGGISGFNSFFAYFPESQTMVAVTANLNHRLQDLLIIVDALFDNFAKSMKTPVLSFRPEGGILILQLLIRSLSDVRDDNPDFLRDRPFWFIQEVA
jgi:D-alanyl-D-alanine carboxypeptidase